MVLQVMLISAAPAPGRKWPVQATKRMMMPGSELKMYKHKSTAHGTSTPVGDLNEVKAIKNTFGWKQLNT